jgi:hypothetical protein
MPLWDTQYDEYRMVFTWISYIDYYSPNYDFGGYDNAIDMLTIGKQLNNKNTNDETGPVSSIYRYKTAEDAADARDDPKIARFFANYQLCEPAFDNGMPNGFDRYLVVIKHPDWAKRLRYTGSYSIAGKPKIVRFEPKQAYAIVAVSNQGQTIEQLPLPKLLKNPPNKRQTLRDAVYPTVLEL